VATSEALVIRWLDACEAWACMKKALQGAPFSLWEGLPAPVFLLRAQSHLVA